MSVLREPSDLIQELAERITNLRDLLQVAYTPPMWLDRLEGETRRLECRKWFHRVRIEMAMTERELAALVSMKASWDRIWALANAKAIYVMKPLGSLSPENVPPATDDERRE